MDDLFTIVPRTVLSKMFEHNLSGVDCMVLVALAHCRVGDEIGITKGGYVMSASDVAEYVSDGMSPEHVRKSLSRMVKKGILVRSRKVKKGHAWLTVYAYAPGVEHGAPDEGGEQPDETGSPVSDRTRVTCHDRHVTRTESVTGGATNRSHTSIDTGIEAGRTPSAPSNPESYKTEVFCEKTREPKYPYPDDVHEVCDYMAESGNVPDHLDAEYVAERFIELNDCNDWSIGGQPVHDWHAALAGFVRHVDEDACSLN